MSCKESAINNTLKPADKRPIEIVPVISDMPIMAYIDSVSIGSIKAIFSYYKL